MKTKKTIAKIIFLSSLAIAFTACGSSNGFKQGRVPPTASAAGAAATPIQGLWQGGCGTELLDSIVSYEFNGSSYNVYTDFFGTDSSCSDSSWVSTTEVSGSFQVSAEGTQGTIQLNPSNGTSPTQEEYFLNGGTSLSLQEVNASGSTFNLQSYTLSTGN